MNILFINGSPNKNGNTKALAEKMLKGNSYETFCCTLWNEVWWNGNKCGGSIKTVQGII